MVHSIGEEIGRGIIKMVVIIAVFAFLVGVAVAALVGGIS
jgi:hypothetical protein